jgi:hypothetical protein
MIRFLPVSGAFIFIVPYFGHFSNHLPTKTQMRIGLFLFCLLILTAAVAPPVAAKKPPVNHYRQYNHGNQHQFVAQYFKVGG